MQKWEYKVISFYYEYAQRWLSEIDEDDVRTQEIALTPYLNKLGDEGWEVVAGANLEYVLKRPKE